MRAVSSQGFLQEGGKRVRDVTMEAKFSDATASLDDGGKVHEPRILGSV